MQSIGEKIKAERLKKKLTVQKLARLSSLSRTTIYNIENNKTMPETKSLECLARALEIHPAQFWL